MAECTHLKMRVLQAAAAIGSYMQGVGNDSNAQHDMQDAVRVTFMFYHMTYH
jgi:hypothetical protein